MENLIICEEQELIDVADAIRAQTGSTETMSLSEMADAVNTFSANGSSAELTKIKDNGGVGYIEYKTTETMPATVVHGASYDYGYTHTEYPIPWPNSISGGVTHAYLNNSKYKLVYDTYYEWQWIHVSGPDCFDVSNIPHNNYAYWHTDYGEAPESITVRFEDIHEIIHPITEKFLPEDYKGIPQKVEALSGGNYIALPKGEYEFEVSDGSYEGYAKLDWDRSASEYMALGKKLFVHVDGTDYLSTMKMLDAKPCVGNPHILDASFEDTGEPFIIYQNNYGEFVTVIQSTSNTHIFGVSVPGATAPMSNVVDMDTFGIGQAILSLYAQGGGTTTLNSPLIEQFWLTMNSISMGKEVRLQVDTGGAIMEVGGVSRAFIDKETCVLVCFGFLYSLDGESVEDIKICLSRKGDNNQCIISVNVS